MKAGCAEQTSTPMPVQISTREPSSITRFAGRLKYSTARPALRVSQRNGCSRQCDIPLSTLGLLQYVGPTLQFLIGVLVFQEPFPRARAVGFVLIWTGLAVYAADSLLRRK